jgi:uncharacterized repeat protein (TIGR03803 family)
MPCRRLVVHSSYSFSVFMVLVILALATFATPSAQAQTFTVLHAFSGGADGAFPGGGRLILDAKGNLYGTTLEGGGGACSGGCGTIFRLDPTGKETVLYSFTGTGGDGKYPNGPLIRDAAGNFYGTTFGGGTSGTACSGYGCGTVFKLDSARQETVLYSFSGGVDGATPEAGLARDAAGNLYGTTHLGGAFNWGTVFVVNPSGNETVLHSFDGLTGDGGDAFAGLILDSSAGILYGTTQGGGNVNSNCLPGLEIGCGTIFQITTTGTETVLYAFTGYKDGNTPFGGVIRDQAGNLYGTTQPRPNPTGWGTIFKLDPAGKLTVLHTFSGGAGGADPLDTLIDSAGSLYGTTSAGGTGSCTYYPDGGCGTVFRLSPPGKFTVLYSFTGGADGANVQAGLVGDAKGNLYGTASWSGTYNEGTVFKITP